MNFWDILYSIFNIAYWYLIISSIILILLENKNPVRTIAWLLVILTIPFAGLIFYFVFGRSYHRQGRLSRKMRKRISDCQNSVLVRSNGTEIAHKVEKYQGLVNMLRSSADSELYANNEVEIITDGNALLDRMLRDIETAKDHIHAEYYIVETDETGNSFKEALIKKAREGVEVRLIYDDVGSWRLKHSTIVEMRQAGIKLQSFFAVRFPFFTNKLNYRNHRKILVVDGEIGYLGGFNIADRYTKGLEWGSWRDTHIRFIGDAVAALQTMYLTDWLYVTGKLHKTARFFPVSSIKNDTFMQVVGSGPDCKWQTIMQGYCKAIQCAKHHIYIQTPYFLPNESVLNALEMAALSGVDVQLMIPYRSDARVSFEASITYLSTLLEAGVKVYQYRAGFIHSKTMVIDDDLAIIGSANMDFRSFDQNFEITSFIYDKEKTQELSDIFKKDLKECRKLTISMWKLRPWWRKLFQSVCRLFSPLL